MLQKLNRDAFGKALLPYSFKAFSEGLLMEPAVDHPRAAEPEAINFK